MSSKETKARVANAFRAMKAIGISEDKVKPVLKHLLKLYDKNWAYIEEENYRVLADTIFERDEAQANERSKKNVNSEAAEHSKMIVHCEVGGSVFHKEDYLEEEAHAAEEPERPLKRLRRKYRDGESSSVNVPTSSIPIMPLLTPKEEPNELPETRLPNLTDGKKKKDVQAISPQRKSVASHALIKPKDEPMMDDDMAHFAGPIAVIHSDPSNDANSSIESGTIREHELSISLSAIENDSTAIANEPTNKGELAMITGQCPNLQIVSSPFGESKISLNRDLALGRQHDFHMPNRETILRLVEGKCLRSYKILDPKFSVMNIMKENKENYADEMNLSLVVYKNPNVTPATLRSVHNVVDISNGQEEFIITVVNEVNDECSPYFYYIPKNAVFRNACVNFSLARIGDKNCCSTCSGDCFSLSKPCACGHASGGEFAYTRDGLVKEELLEECISMNRDPKEPCRSFCKECPRERAKGEENIGPCRGHLMRRFIKECWWKCGCDRKCGNRVVQRGISCNLQVFMTAEGKGWGLRTLADLPKGAFVCEYAGEILTSAELYDRVLRCSKGEKFSYTVVLDADWGTKGVMRDEKALCLDATYYGNVGRFINHRCYDSNLVEIPVEVETPDRYYYHLAFFTTRKVNAMEELTWDYGIDFDDHDQLIKAFHCECGSNFCRYMKHSRTTN